MARINLLPWREERRKQQQRDFYGALGLSVILGVLLSFLMITYYSMQVSGQNSRNEFLQSEIKKLDEQIKEIEELDNKRNNLLARKKVIEELQANRSQMVHLFDSLVRTIPDGVMLTSLKQDGNILTLEGRAQSSTRVSNYMRNLEGSGWMTKPDLSIIEAKEAKEADKKVVVTNHVLPYMFTVRVTLSDPNTSFDTQDSESSISVAGDTATSEAQQTVQNPDAADASTPEAATTAPVNNQTPAAEGSTSSSNDSGAAANDGTHATEPKSEVEAGS